MTNSLILFLVLQVTVIEKESMIGGKAATVGVEGKFFDLGGHVCTSACSVMADLARELGIGTHHILPSLIIDNDGRCIQAMAVDRMDLAPLVKKLHEVGHAFSFKGLMFWGRCTAEY